MASKGAETASESGSGAGGRGPRGRGVTGFVAAVASGLLELLRRHGIGLATAVAVLGGLLLLYAETLDLYRIVTPSGSVSNATGSVRTGSDQHSWAFAVIGVAGAAAAVLGWVTRERLPALAAAMLGVIALVVALAVDLPDVTASGVTTDLEVGDAEPGDGFWVEIAGALVMTAGAAALAGLLTPKQEGEQVRSGARP
jgi:hypothetical protein